MDEQDRNFVYPPTPGPDREPARDWQDSFTAEDLKTIALARQMVEEHGEGAVSVQARIIARMADLLDQARLE